MDKGRTRSWRSPKSDKNARNIYFFFLTFNTFICLFFSAGTAFSDPVSQAPAAPASQPPQITLPTLSPPQQPSQSPPTPETPASISQNAIISQGNEAFRSGDYRRAHDLLEEALLDAGPSGLPPDALIELASSSRRIGHAGRAIALLLPLVSTKVSTSLSPITQRRIHYELAMADRDKGNDDGAVNQLIPIFSDLSRSHRIRHATGILLDHWRKTDPVSGAILMGQSLGRLDPPDQKIVMTRTIDLIFRSIRDESGLLKVLSSFPRDFPGDYAAYRLALFDARAKHPKKAEKILLRLILFYPESLYISEAEQLLNRISMGGNRTSIGLIIPDLSRGPLKPYMRSILTGAILGFETSSDNGPTLIVRFVTGHESYSQWYDDLLHHENIAALIGPFLINDLNSVRSRLIHDQILALTPTLAASSDNRFMISMASLPPMVASAIAQFSISLVPKAHAVILYPTDYYGKTFRTSFENALTSSGGSLTAGIPIERGEGKRQEAVLKLRRYGDVVSVPSKGPFPEGVSGRSGDFVTSGGKSYYLVYPPKSAQSSHPTPFFFKPDFDIIVFPNDSLHPFKVLDELVYKNIQNVNVLANESLMMARRQWDMVSDIHNPLYSVAPVNLFHLARGQSSQPTLRMDYSRLIQVTGRSPDLLELESYDCTAFLSQLFKGGFKTRYHLGVTALAGKSYNGLSGLVSWGPAGMMSRTYTLYRFSGGDWKPISTKSISYKKDQK